MTEPLSGKPTISKLTRSHVSLDWWDARDAVVGECGVYAAVSQHVWSTRRCFCPVLLLVQYRCAPYTRCARGVRRRRETPTKIADRLHRYEAGCWARRVQVIARRLGAQHQLTTTSHRRRYVTCAFGVYVIPAAVTSATCTLPGRRRRYVRTADAPAAARRARPPSRRTDAREADGDWITSFVRDNWPLSLHMYILCNTKYTYKSVEVRTENWFFAFLFVLGFFFDYFFYLFSRTFSREKQKQ